MKSERQHCEETIENVALMTKRAFVVGMLLGLLLAILFFVSI